MIINGYTELNDNNSEEYKLLLKLMKGMSASRILLSICNCKSGMMYYERLKDFLKQLDDIEDISLSDWTSIMDVIDKVVVTAGTLPTAKVLFERLFDIRYSEEFMSDWLLNEDDLLIVLKEYCEGWKKVICADLLRSGLREVKDKVITREQINKMEDLTRMAFDNPFEDNFYNLKGIYDEEQQVGSIDTIIPEFNKNGARFNYGSVNTVFAYTGGFKTMYCSNVAYQAIKEGKNVLYVSLEINQPKMYYNFLSRQSFDEKFKIKISHSSVKRKELSDEEETIFFNDIYNEFGKYKEHLLVFDETNIDVSSPDTFSIALKTADRLFQKKTGKGLEFLIVDHINLLKFNTKDREGRTDYSLVNHWMSFFRKNAVNFLETKRKICILCACQSSRSGYEKAIKDDGIYSLQAIAEGNEIERSSELVISIFADSCLRAEHRVRMQLLKFRDGKVIEVPFSVDICPEYYTFGLPPTKEMIEEMSAFDDAEWEEEEWKFYENRTSDKVDMFDDYEEKVEDDSELTFSFD